MDAPRVPWNYTLPNGNVAVTMDVCYQMLRDQGIPPVPEPTDGSLWCNATYDTVLCWPPTPANTSIVLPCPPLKGLDPTQPYLFLHVYMYEQESPVIEARYATPHATWRDTLIVCASAYINDISFAPPDTCSNPSKQVVRRVRTSLDHWNLL
ncbi:hypothetical protein Y032_0061g3275 [Ancylostoma ceylanicum]|uniref:G-protein coupled receptors family 2 profile 1 domain-containing protein n=1 Tax=Ancylostoma ceylanicum TaxID=53326 RepID=A0A016U1X1_9BILA|nr:hypothetical protein Y032_0061g3275 [Ancylostoma ceylanicum]